MRNDDTKTAPETAAHRRADNVHLRERNAQSASNTRTDSERPLRGCPHRNLAR